MPCSIRVTGQSQQAYVQLDPRELMALTLADVWNLTTDGRATIIGQGGAIRPPQASRTQARAGSMAAK